MAIILIVFSIHNKYEVSLTGASRGKSVVFFYLAVGTLIRIRNVYFFYKKSGVVSFFQDIEWNKVELYGFFWNYLKNVKLCMGFSGRYTKKNGDMCSFKKVSALSEFLAR